MTDHNRALRRVALAGATALTAGLLVTVPSAPAAVAGQCSSSTGGSSDWVMWTGSSYTCAYESKSDKKKIGAFNTYTWMSNTAFGYTKRDHRWKQTGGVSTSYVYVDGGGSVGSSITFTAFNTEDGSRHWGAAVMWNTPKAGKIASGQYKSDDYEYDTNRFHVSKISVSGPTEVAAGTPASYSVTVTDPDGGTKPSGVIALMLQPGSKPSPTTKDCDGKVTSQGNDTGLAQGALSSGAGTLTTPALGPGTYTMYAVYAGSLNSKNRPIYCDSPPHDGLTPAQSGSWTLTVGEPGTTRGSDRMLSAPRRTVTPGLAAVRSGTAGTRTGTAVVNRTFVTGPDGGTPARAMACPAGSALLQVNAGSPTRVLPERLLTRSHGRIGIVPGAAPQGTRITVQLVCRDRDADAKRFGKLVLGGRGDDHLRTRKPNSTVLAGAGDDRVLLSTRGSAAFGFTGADQVTLATSRGAVHGGPGADVLVARQPGAVLLVGGNGHDVLRGAHGRTLINAQDGAGGDRIVCRSPKNVVLADPGDQVVGPCTVR